MPFKLIFIIAALVLFILAGIGVPSSRYSLVAFGLAALTLGVWLVP